MKKTIKKIIHKNNGLFDFYYNYIYKPKDALSIFLDNYSKSNKKSLFFIQVGANDGQWNDPIYKFIRRDKWSGVLIEPQKTIFKRLQHNYKDFKNLYFENLALDSFEGEKILYRISFSQSQWASGISSFIKSDVQKLIEAGYVKRMSQEEKIIPPKNLDDWISEEIVQVKTFKYIIENYSIQKIDLVMIDTEGYDFEIIKTIPFEIIKPKIIIYEHTHFNEFTKQECSAFLTSKGYLLSFAESDTIAELIK